MNTTRGFFPKSGHFFQFSKKTVKTLKHTPVSPPLVTTLCSKQVDTQSTVTKPVYEKDQLNLKLQLYGITKSTETL